MKHKPLKYKIIDKKPRGKMPPPSKVFKDRKKEKNKKFCRGKNNDQ